MDALYDFLGRIERALIAPLITLLALGAFAIFVWGVVQFIMNADDEEKRTKGKSHMVYGIIGLVIIFGTNAIIAIIKASVGAN